MRRLARSLPGLLSFGLVAFAGCATYEQELYRAEEHFTHDEHENSLATLRALEEDWVSLGTRDRARYCYLRGMTDYRIGFKADARHWLAVALEIERESPGALSAAEKKLVEDKLGEMNAVVWAGDVLPQEEVPGSKAPKKAKPKEATEDADDDKAPKKDDESGKPKKKADDDDESGKPKKKAADDESGKPKKKAADDDESGTAKKKKPAE